MNDEECSLNCIQDKCKLLHEHENKGKNDFIACITNMSMGMRMNKKNGEIKR